jgi:phosphatidylglycerophosphate synthase
MKGTAMLDAYVSPLLEPSLNKAGGALVKWGVKPNTVTFIGFGAGCVAIVLIAHQWYLSAAIWIVFNRLCDGLDGAVTRASEMTDLGGFLDISCDFIIYAGVVFGFAYAQPEHGFWAAFLIFSYIGPITTFLAYAVMAEKYQVVSGRKSFYYLGGICEGSETAFVMILLCLKPSWFVPVCFIYGVMCWLTTVGRVLSAFSLASCRQLEAKIKRQGQ